MGTAVYKTFVQCYTVDVVRGMASGFADWRLSGVGTEGGCLQKQKGDHDMRINIRTFQFVVGFLLVLGLIASLCEFREVRYLGYGISLGSVYLFYQIDREIERQRHRARYYRRIYKLVEQKLYS